DPEKLPGQQELKIRHIGEAGKKMVYVTIGGGSQLIGESFINLVLEMFRLMPDTQGVISTGLFEDAVGYNPPDNVLIRGFVPGTEMIKACDVLVFHGGSSTLMTCLACGKPAVVVPSIGEQEDNGAVLAKNGAGIVLDKNTVTTAALVEAVQQIFNNSEFKNNAGQLKKMCENYGGAAAAATMVEELISGGVTP
ncbi:MAG TPA: nucleotide disphospho-sugar-binding domain-containing protein, partial [Negativicutes bacterium]